MLNARVLPDPHRYAVCSHADMSIKEFYKGIFEEVFIFFHPFIKPKTIDYELFMPDTYPARSEIKEHCEMVRWKEFLKISGVSDYRQLDIGLRSIILGLNKKYADDDTAKVIMDVCEQHEIVRPTEGLFPEFIMDELLQQIKKLGHDWIWCGDEFCTERKLEYMDDIINDSNMLNYERKNLFTHDQTILLTTHWDSHFSMVCSNKETLKKLVDASQLEGFYCNDRTEIYWSLRE
ncbi:DUF2711 family protein [Rossellomorea sp. NS-SX7]|uniref:DUF2711 family protein n=1 Tax=Rossellomorea sp. NS-SX7 TaxID=3463856 RepID=UPI0040581220